MSDLESIVADRNAKTALSVVEKIKSELTDRINRLEFAATDLTQKYSDLDRKYNLLLTKRFNGGSTAE